MCDMRIAATVCLALAVFSAGAAPILTWDASAGAEGYRLYCGPTPIVAVPVPIDAAAETTIDMVGTLDIGTQYECWVTAYADAQESGHSNHLVFTSEPPPVTVTIPGVPKSFTIRFEDQ